MTPSSNDPLGLVMQWIAQGHAVCGETTMLSCQNKIWALSRPDKPIPNRPISLAEAREHVAAGVLGGDPAFVLARNDSHQANGLAAVEPQTLKDELLEYGGCWVDDMALDPSPDACAEMLLDALDAGCLLTAGGREGSERYEAVAVTSPSTYRRQIISDDGGTETTHSREELFRHFEYRLSERPGPDLPSRPRYFLDQALKHLGHETVRQYVRSTTAIHTLERNVYAASRNFWEPYDLILNVLHPWAAVDTGRSIYCADVASLKRHARRVDGVWMVSSSLTLSSEFAGFRLPQDMRTLLVAGDLFCEARLEISCSLIVGGTIRCGEFYKNADVEKVVAKAISAERYVYVEYPGEHFAVTDHIEAPLVFFSNVAWECPKIDADVFIPDHDPAAIEAALPTICRVANVDPAEFDRFVQTNELEVSEAVEETLREGRIPG